MPTELRATYRLQFHADFTLDDASAVIDYLADLGISSAFMIRYHEHAVPVNPRSLDGLLAMAAERCRSDVLAFIADALGWLPPATATDWASVHRRHRDKEILRQQLARFLVEQPGGAAAIPVRPFSGVLDHGSEIGNVMSVDSWRIEDGHTGTRVSEADVAQTLLCYVFDPE